MGGNLKQILWRRGFHKAVISASDGLIPKSRPGLSSNNVRHKGDGMKWGPCALQRKVKKFISRGDQNFALFRWTIGDWDGRTGKERDS
jgi:hypothetical protein